MTYMCEESDGKEFEESQVQKFYKDAVIFITGGTGFLGVLLIEKILRNCPNISRIFLLIRDKKGKTTKERFQNLFDDVVFERVLRSNSKIFDKVELIHGDCSLPELGLSLADKHKLIEQVNIVFHLAASVKFDEELRKAINIHVRATRDLFQIATEMKHLKSIVYVSTAYSFCVNEEINEQVHDVDISADKLIKMSENLNEKEMEILNPHVIKPWPNTYVFTKAVAENVVRTFGNELPVAIVRPSIVIGTKSEPVAGWVNNYYGMNGIMMGTAIGLLHTGLCDCDALLDMVPADYVTNAIIVAACAVASKRAVPVEETSTFNINSDKVVKEKEIDVYNYVGSLDWPMTLRQMMKLTKKYGLSIPSTFCIWYPFCIMTKNKYMYYIYVWLLHYIPAYIMDICALSIGKKPRLLDAYRKIHKFTSSTEYFSIRQWKFCNNNVRNLWKNQNETDRKLFPFDLSSVDWDSYIYTYLRGLRVYVLKDPLDTIPEGKRKYFKLKIAHYTLVSILGLLMTVIMFSLMICLFNMF